MCQNTWFATEVMLSMQYKKHIKRTTDRPGGIVDIEVGSPLNTRHALQLVQHLSPDAAKI